MPRPLGPNPPAIPSDLRFHARLAGAGRSGLVCLVLALGTGCSGALGPETFPVASVKGRVTEGGKPVTRGWIEFYLVDGAVGNLRSARIAPDGTFAADGVAVGQNLVRLVNMPIETLAIRRILGAFHSPIRRRIPPGGDKTIVVDVADEFLRYQQSLVAGVDRGSAGSRR